MRSAVCYSITVIVSFTLGTATHAWVTRRAVPTEKEAIANHWQLVNDYIRYMNDPANYSWDHTPGFLGTKEPFDPMPHLAALVASNELQHLNIVLPLVPATRKANQHWIEFASQHRESIVYMLGNEWSRDFPVSGDSVMHLKLWFRPSATAEVQQLLRELEEMSFAGKFD